LFDAIFDGFIDFRWRDWFRVQYEDDPYVSTIKWRQMLVERALRRHRMNIREAGIFVELDVEIVFWRFC